MKKTNPVKPTATASASIPWHYAWWLAGVIPAMLLLGLLQKYALNLPIMDDYDAILGFLNQWQEQSGSQRWSALISQHNEHRILSSRLIYAGWYLLTGQINILGIIYIANLQLLLIFVLLSIMIIRFLGNYGYFLIAFAGLCVFDASSYDNSNFAMSGLQNYGVILWFLSAMFCYTRKGYGWLAAGLFFQGMCMFSSGSGLLGGICLFLFALLSRNKINMVTTGVTTLALGLAYYAGYRQIPNEMAGKSLGGMMEFFLKLSAGHFGADQRILIGIVLYATLVICGFLLWRKGQLFTRETAPILSLLLFILAGIASISVFRSGGKNGIDLDSYTSRYLILSHLLAFVVMAAVAAVLKTYTWKWAVLGLAGLFYLKAYQQHYQYGEANFEKTQQRLLNVPFYYPDSTIAERITKTSCNKAIYCIDDHRYDAAE